MKRLILAVLVLGMTGVCIADSAQLPLPKFKSPAEQTAYVKLLHDLLEAGLGTKPDGLKTAEQHFLAAQKIADADPRLRYAYSLVLLKRLKYDDMFAQLDAATKAPAPLFPPAWQLTIQQRLARKDYAVGLDKLVRYAAAIEASTAAYPDDATKDAAAAWMGRIVAYLEGPANLAKKDADIVTQHEARIRAALRDTRLAAYEQGKIELETDAEQLQTVADEKRDAAQQKQQEETEFLKKETGESQKQVQDEKEKLKKTADEWKTWFDKETGEIDKRLTQLQTTFNQIEIQGQGLSNTIGMLNSQIASLEAQAATAAQGQSKSTTATGAINQQMQQLILQRNNYAAQYNQLDAQAAGIRREAQPLITRRATVVAQYQKETGQIVKQNDALQKFDKSLSQKEKALNKAAGKGTAKPAAKPGDAKSQAITSYFPLDFAAERERILATFPRDER